MKYLLDFDGVLFDTQTLKKKMAELQIEESLRSTALFGSIKESDPAFDIRALVFDDAQEFLKVHARSCEIVSSYVSSNPNNDQDPVIQKEYQQLKIQLSGIEEAVGKEQVHVVGASKKEMLGVLQEQYKEQGEECLFIDDRRTYVEEARSLGMLSVWMNRTGAHAEEEQYQVGSFRELIQKLEIWKN